MTLHIIKGKTHPAPRRVIFGPPGVGKSTWACAEPGALALDYESGLESIGVDRVKGADSFDSTLALVKEACAGDGDHRAVIIDTVDRIEDQASAQVCKDGKKKSLADFGYGDGYEAVATRWRELLGVLELARAKNRSVTLVAHVVKQAQDDPMLGKYDKYIAALSKRCWGATHRWADCVLFATYESGLVEGRAIMTGNRILYTQAATGFDAKHRPNIAPVLPLSWEAYAQAVSASQRPAEEVISSIRSLAKGEDVAKAERYIQEATGDSLRLANIETALKKKAHA